MFPVDLSNAFFQISIHPDFVPYLRNALDGKVCQFKVLCFFYFSTASQVFTREFSLLSQMAHRKGIHTVKPKQFVCHTQVGP